MDKNNLNSKNEFSTLEEKISNFVKSVECKEKVSPKKEAKLADKYISFLVPDILNFLMKSALIC